jgi:hypothetical protein
LYKTFKYVFISFLLILAIFSGKSFLFSKEIIAFLSFFFLCFSIFGIFIFEFVIKFFLEYNIIKVDWIEKDSHIITNSDTKLGEFHYFTIKSEKK